MLRLILLLVVIILVLSFFGVSLQSLFNAPTTQANFGFAWELIVNGWNVIVHFFESLLALVGIHVS